MENQHRKIHGYRELSAEEIALMNEIKSLGPVIETVLNKVQDHISRQQQAFMRDAQSPDANVMEAAQLEAQRINDATPSRFAALAKSDLQTGLMYLTRAVAQPTFF